MEMTCVSKSVKTVEVLIRRKYVHNSLDFTAMSWISDDQMTQNASMRHKIKVPDVTAENNLIRTKTPGLSQIPFSGYPLNFWRLKGETLCFWGMFFST